MVGEIRDAETAENAIQAALTGHLVLSTLHTNDAPSAITRLLDLGIPSFLQRLHPAGRSGPAPRASHLHPLQGRPHAGARRNSASWGSRKRRGGHPLVAKRGRGCVHCRKTGYFGRQGIFEMLRVDESAAGAHRPERPFPSSSSAITRSNTG